VLEEDGTEIDEDELDIIRLAGSTFILLEKDQCWSDASPASATSTSVEEPTKAAAAALEHYQTPSTNTSKTFQKKTMYTAEKTTFAFLRKC